MSDNIFIDTVQRIEKVIEEVKHPYTKKNNSYLLFCISLCYLVPKALLEPVGIFIQMLQIQRQGAQAFAHNFMVRSTSDLIFSCIPVLLLILSIVFRKKW